jgi:hypothetical protein
MLGTWTWWPGLQPLCCIDVSMQFRPSTELSWCPVPSCRSIHAIYIKPNPPALPYLQVRLQQLLLPWGSQRPCQGWAA